MGDHNLFRNLLISELAGRLNFLERSWGPIEPFDITLPKVLAQKNVFSHIVTDHPHYFRLGGELCSLTGKKENTEYLWDGNPEYWKYHAPTLFPIVGKTKNFKYKSEGNFYELPAYGLARISNFELISQIENSLTFELKDSEDSIKVYTYKFSLQIKYIIEESSVNIIYTVTNLDNKEILFSIGAHPAFMCPIDKNEIIEDCYLEFNKFPYLGLWSPEKGAPFLCIEPWFGHADYEDFNGDFKDKEGVNVCTKEILH